MASEKNQFSEGDNLLCYHGPMLYEAKCLKQRKLYGGKVQYFVHYKGWKNKWDEWVNNDRILAVNADNTNKMVSLKKSHLSSKKGGAKRSITVTSEETIHNTTPPVKGKKRKHSEISSSYQTISVPSSSEPKPKKRGRPPKMLNKSKKNLSKTSESSAAIELIKANITEIMESDKIKNEIEETNIANIVLAPVVKAIPVINIPTILKERILYDKLMVTQYNKIPKISKENTAEKLIRGFICAHTYSEFFQRERALNTGLTLMQYFNNQINKSLLYHEERVYGIKMKAQSYLVRRVHKKKITFYFKDILFPKRLWHYAYGPIYLLRLFDKLPKLLVTYNYNENQMKFVVENFHAFLKFVENNFEKYFSDNDYEENK